MDFLDVLGRAWLKQVNSKNKALVRKVQLMFQQKSLQERKSIAQLESMSRGVVTIPLQSGVVLQITVFAVVVAVQLETQVSMNPMEYFTYCAIESETKANRRATV